MRRILLFASATLIFALASPTRAGELIPPASQRFAAPDTQEDPSFRQHVLPLMGRLGCNGRACHGSFQGRGGFRLSLFGYDFKADHEALAGGETPRVNTKTVAESLILQKPTLTIDHEGGERMKPGSWEYRLFERWIEGGAKGLAKDEPDFGSLEITPREILFTKPGQSVQLKVVAHWSTGKKEDVTPITRFRSNDESIATIDENGKVTSTGKGDTHVVAFYDNGVVPVQVILPVSEQVGKKFPVVAAPTKIDQLVVDKLKKLGVVPSGLATDDEFLRRVNLDMTGTLPSADEVKAFLADASPDKRAKKIDELLKRPAYAAWWATKLCDATGNTESNVGENNFRADVARQWHQWIERRVATNEPYDKLVEGIVLATSRKPDQSFEEYCEEMSSYFRKDNPADFTQRDTMPHYWTRRLFNQPKEKALSFSYAFLGVRLQCAECHKHPFDQWTKQDFEQFTAFFNGVTYNTRKEDTADFKKLQESLAIDPKLAGNQARQAMVKLVSAGKTIPWREVYVNASANRPSTSKSNTKAKTPTGRVITPKLLGGEEVVAQEYPDSRKALMDWMRREDNPYFAKAFVNRVWANYFNVGIVEPADDMNLANPPSNVPLLDYLTKAFVEHDYDMMWLHREIANSHTYQRSWQTNPTNVLDQRNFSHSVVRRLPAEVAYDAVVLATASDKAIQALHSDTSNRAIGVKSTLNLAQANNANNSFGYVMSLFGKPTRLTNCDCERSNEASLLQSIFLRNDAAIYTFIDSTDGWIKQLSRSGEEAKKTTSKSRSKLELAGETLAKLEKRLQKAKDSGDKKQLAKEVEKARQERDKLAKAEREAAKAKAAQAKPKSHLAVGHDELVREAYLRTLSRLPNDKELATAKNHLAQSGDALAGTRDLLWALLNTKEFILNR